MAILDKIKSFFRKPKAKGTTKQPEPVTKTAQEETPQTPEEKAGDASQQPGSDATQ
jgi:hypothetical protein